MNKLYIACTDDNGNIRKSFLRDENGKQITRSFNDLAELFLYCKINNIKYVI